MRAKTHGLAQSVQTRLIQHARSLGVESELVLTRFATERFLYRLTRSPHAERFVLRGRSFFPRAAFPQHRRTSRRSSSSLRNL